MAVDQQLPETDEDGRLRLIFPAVIAATLAIFGLMGLAGAAAGYGLFLIATLLLLSGGVLTLLFLFTRRFDTAKLRRALGTAFWLGGWTYVFAVSALAGYYTRETLAGRMELKWVLFGPAVLAAIVILDVGLYRLLYKRNAPTLARYGDVISRDRLDPKAMRSTLVDEVVVHRSLFRVSPFRWLRHQLILWGFALMFATEIVALFLREVFPSIGLGDIWRSGTHPLRLACDFAFDITGLMMLIGCVLALFFRLRVAGTPDQKFTDTPTAVFLLAVVVTGFAVEGLRIASAPGLPQYVASPVGIAFSYLMAPLVGAGKGARDALWIFHALLSCAFIAYVPIKRLVHSCATPMGRLMNSQKDMLAAKKERVLRGLLERQINR